MIVAAAGNAPIMTSHAEGTFSLTGWDESPIEEQPTKLSTATLTQTWTGDAEGDAVVRTLMHYAPDGTAVLAGTLRFTGAVDGRRGGFVATGRATSTASTSRSTSPSPRGRGPASWRVSQARAPSTPPRAPRAPGSST